MNASIWQNLTEIQELKLNKNEIEVIPKDIFFHQQQIKILYVDVTISSFARFVMLFIIFREINRNKLKTIKGLTFKSLKYLDTLKLKKNEINHLPDAAFYGLDHLHKL